MMPSINIDQEKVQDIARKQAQFLKSRNANGAGYNILLQSLCQALFSMPYEEAQKTILVPDQEPLITYAHYPHCHVVILQYGTEKAVLTLAGKLHAEYSIDMNYSINDVELEAATLAQTQKTSWRKVALPMALNEDQSNNSNEIIALAKKMQIFDFKETLFEQLCGNDIRITINKNACPYSLDGDMDYNLQSAIEEEDIDPFVTCIWHAEYNSSHSSDRFEHFFTLGDIASAKPSVLPNRWIVSEIDDEAVEIQVN
jgi:hypothetical protein